MLPPVDVRRKRPPALSFLLRMETLRRAARVVSLLALDFAGLLAALIVALMVKAVLREHEWAWDASLHEARRTIAFAYLVTVLLFARSGLYAERAQRPGLARIVSSLFQVTVVSLIFALVNDQQYSSYYIFYGTLFFAVIILGSARWAYEMVTGALLRAAGYRRRAVLVGSGRHIEDVAHALTDEVHAPVEMVGFISLTPRPDNGLRSLGRIEDVARGARRLPRPGGDHRRPGLPAGARGRARGHLPPARRDRARSRRRRWRSSSSAPSSCRAPRCRCSSCARRSSTASTSSSSARSTSSSRLFLLLVLSPLLALIALLVRLSSRGPIIYRSYRPGHRR